MSHAAGTHSGQRVSAHRPRQHPRHPSHRAAPRSWLCGAHRALAPAGRPRERTVQQSRLQVLLLRTAPDHPRSPHQHSGQTATVRAAAGRRPYQGTALPLPVALLCLSQSLPRDPLGAHGLSLPPSRRRSRGRGTAQAARFTPHGHPLSQLNAQACGPDILMGQSRPHEPQLRSLQTPPAQRAGQAAPDAPSSVEPAQAAQNHPRDPDVASASPQSQSTRRGPWRPSAPPSSDPVPPQPDLPTCFQGPQKASAAVCSRRWHRLHAPHPTTSGALVRTLPPPTAPTPARPCPDMGRCPLQSSEVSAWERGSCLLETHVVFWVKTSYI